MDVAEFIPNSPEDSISYDILLAKFKTFAKENFQDYVKKDLDYIQFIKKSGIFSSLQLPSDKCEFFVSYETVPFYWLCDFPVILKYEEWLKNDSKNKAPQSDNYKSIKELYSKWAIVASENDRRYYALSAIKLIERDNNKTNVIKSILQAVILIYDRKLFNPEKALELLTSANIEITQQKVDDWVRNELQYLINVHAGFLYLKQKLPQEANQKFTEALISKSSGITAKFYIALTDKKLEDRETASQMLTEVIEYDKAVLKLAIEKNNLTLLAYAVQNAVTYHIFNEYDFADMLDDISDIIMLAAGNDPSFIESISTSLSKLNELKYQEFYDEEVVKNINFLEKILNVFRESKNTFVGFFRDFLFEKIQYIVQLIIDILSKKYTTEMFERLSLYDIEINRNLDTIKVLTKEIEEVRTAHQKKQEDSIQNIEKRISETIILVENKINNIHLDKRFNPHTTFNNAMVYNLIVTAFVFIIGGFSGCYSGTINDVYNFKDVMSAVIISGFKWSAVTFLAGMIIASFAAAFAFMERANEKQGMIKKITYLKSQKEREIEIIKRDNEKKLKVLIDNLTERIAEHKSNVDSFKNEKQQQFDMLQEETNNKIKEQTDKLSSVLNIPQNIQN